MILLPTYLTDPETGEPLYVEYIPHSRLYWHYRRLRLFLSIVWRRYEDRPLSWRVSWDVANIIYREEIGQIHEWVRRKEVKDERA